MTRVLAVVLAALALASGIALQQWLPSGKDAPVPLPAMELPDLQDHPHRLDDWHGRVVLVNFWASWCEPCREEIPAFNRLQQRYGAQGLQIVGIALDDDAAVRAFQATQPMDYPVLLAPEQGAALMDELGNSYGALPYTAIFGRDGLLVYSHPGGITEAEAEEQLKRLLGPAGTQ